MAEPSTAQFSHNVLPNLNSNIVNQKSFTVNAIHSSAVQTITTSATITGITAPQYLVNDRTGEVIYAEGISGLTFTTCTRGADGTTAAAMAVGDILYPVISANLYNQLIREVMAIAPYASNADPIVLQSIIMEQIRRFQKPDGQIDHNVLSNTHNLTTSIDHATINNLNSTTYTHLTAANHTDLTDAGATTLHKHDHGGQDGLTDDDHPQYELKAENALIPDPRKFLKPDSQIDHDALANFVANEHLDWTADLGATNLHANNIPDISGTYATAAKGVTNRDTHNHAGGDGGQVDHTGLANIGTNTHGTIDSFISSKAAANGLASLNASSKVVEDPANATATPTAGKIPIADGAGLLDGWVTPGSYSLTYSDILQTQVFN